MLLSAASYELNGPMVNGPSLLGVSIFFDRECGHLERSVIIPREAAGHVQAGPVVHQFSDQFALLPGTLSASVCQKRGQRSFFLLGVILGFASLSGGFLAQSIAAEEPGKHA
jgi:hypothetical protein